MNISLATPLEILQTNYPETYKAAVVKGEKYLNSILLFMKKGRDSIIFPKITGKGNIIFTPNKQSDEFLKSIVKKDNNESIRSEFIGHELLSNTNNPRIKVGLNSNLDLTYTKEGLKYNISDAENSIPFKENPKNIPFNLFQQYPEFLQKQPDDFYRNAWDKLVSHKMNMSDDFWKSVLDFNGGKFFDVFNSEKDLAEREKMLKEAMQAKGISFNGNSLATQNTPTTNTTSKPTSSSQSTLTTSSNKGITLSDEGSKVLKEIRGLMNKGDIEGAANILWKYDTSLSDNDFKYIMHKIDSEGGLNKNYKELYDFYSDVAQEYLLNQDDIQVNPEIEKFYLNNAYTILGNRVKSVLDTYKAQQEVKAKYSNNPNTLYASQGTPGSLNTMPTRSTHNTQTQTPPVGNTTTTPITTTTQPQSTGLTPLETPIEATTTINSPAVVATTPNSNNTTITTPITTDNANSQTTITSSTTTPPPTTWETIKKGLGNFSQGLVANLPNFLSLYGQYKASNDALNTLIESRKGDTPNINPYVNYGQKALDELDKSFQNLGYTRDANLANLNRSMALNAEQIRNNTLSTATANTLAQNAYAQGLKAHDNIQNNYLNSLNTYYGNRANMLNNIDQVVMQGEAQRDLADRQDRDAFYSNLSQAYANQSAGYQQLAKSFNEMTTNNVMTKLVNSLSRYGFKINPYTGDIEKKEK